MTEAIEKIKEKITQTKLNISRVPKNTIDRFKQIASDDEFCGDYGMLLRQLLLDRTELQQYKKIVKRLLDEDKENM